MLRDCLTSLVKQQQPDDCRLKLIVVDNNHAPEAEGLVGEFAAQAPMPVHYRHEPEPGIATARNCAIEAALELDADWIAFIDDDETAAGDWIANLLVAAERHNADVVEGRTIRQYPSRLPPFVIDYQPRCEPEGTVLEYACTNNVLFGSWIVRPDGAKLRFDTTFNVTGGEDLDFFLHARAAGARMVQTRTARASETIPAERLTLRAHLGRLSGEAASNALFARQGRHPETTTIGSVRKMMTRGTIGLLYMVAAPFFLFGGRERFERAVVRGARRLAWSWGTARGLLGRLPTPYSKTEGY
jgi:succinoglycan biosynthesis protein ExoM